jgi:hypothetical protein
VIATAAHQCIHFVFWMSSGETAATLGWSTCGAGSQRLGKSSVSGPGDSALLPPAATLCHQSTSSRCRNREKLRVLPSRRSTLHNNRRSRTVSRTVVFVTVKAARSCALLVPYVFLQAKLS